jgi:phosphate transport system permease protein
MTDLQATALNSAKERRELVRASLRRRHRSERLFRILGIVAICAALGFVALLFADVLRKGLPAFSQATLHLEVNFDPQILGVEPAPVRAAGQSDADFADADLKWRRSVALLNWNKVIEASMRTLLPAGLEIDSRQLLTVPETNARHVVREAFVADPSLMGQKQTFSLLASANVDNWV